MAYDDESPYTVHPDAVMKDPRADRYIEDDFKVLRELDDRIAELIKERHQRIDMIREQHVRNSQKLQGHEDWFEGSVRCNPVPAREQGMESERFRL